MNKSKSAIMALSLLSSACIAQASQTINLPVTVNTVAANREMVLPLNSLPTDKPYRVTCHIDATGPAAMQMSLTPRLAPNGGFGVVKMNGKAATKNSGQLQPGANTVSFLVSVANNSSQPSDLIFKNLDSRFASTVKSCDAELATNVTDAAHQVAGGYFYVTNHLGYFVDISIGNYFPTDYCLYPYYSQYIETSTGYQNIDINGTHY